jgi:glycosidase
MWKRILLLYNLQIGNFLFICLPLLLLISGSSLSQSHRDWSYNLSIYEVNVRQYTSDGTFSAFETHLERLKEMGVGILWFMPIHPIGEQNRLGSLGSYYSVKDYLAVNPEFGTLEEFKAMVARIHDMGIYVIMDWVANHTAWDNPLTITNPEWYSKDGNGNFIPPPGTNWFDVIDLDYSQQGLREYMIDAMKFWIIEADVDGFRCDAAGWVPLDFWETAISELKSLKPGIIMLAEADGIQYQNVGFDMTFAWGLHGFGNGILKKIANGIGNVNALDSYILSELSNFSAEHYRMYFTSNHDENSWHGTVFEQFGNAAEVFAVLVFTFNGMPLIYGGQEAGINKRLLFFDKDQIEWIEHPFTSLYTTLSDLKRGNSALWNGNRGGEFQRVNSSNDQAIFAFVRVMENDKLFAILNLSNQEQSVKLEGNLFVDEYSDVFSNEIIAFAEGATITLPSWGYSVYESGEQTSGLNDPKVPEGYQLSQNYPNPFNSTTTIEFSLPKNEFVTLEVLDLSGRKVKVLLNEQLSIGNYALRFNTSDLASGIYYYRLVTPHFFSVKRAILLR